jgi:hypothetical protein
MKKHFFVLLITAYPFLTYGQEKINVSGLVKDKTTGEPLIGTSIIVGQNSKGTSSDSYGFYSLEITSQPNVILKASYVGYTDYYVTLKGTGAFLNKVNNYLNTDNPILLTAGHLFNTEVNGIK